MGDVSKTVPPGEVVVRHNLCSSVLLVILSLASSWAHAEITGSAVIYRYTGTDSGNLAATTDTVTDTYDNTIVKTGEACIGRPDACLYVQATVTARTAFSQNLTSGVITGALSWSIDEPYSFLFAPYAHQSILATYDLSEPYHYALRVTAPQATSPNVGPYTVVVSNLGDSILYVSNSSEPIDFSAEGELRLQNGNDLQIQISNLACGMAAGCSYAGNLSGNIQFAMTLTPISAPAALTLKQPTVAGCKSVVGTVTLPTPAPPGGTVVELSDTLASATSPISVTIAEGAVSRNFTIKTVPVSSSELGHVSATLNGTTVSRPLTIRPMGMSSLALTPGTVVGSQPVTGTAKLECNAGPGPVTVDLSSGNPAVAAPVAASIVVPQGQSSALFDVTTNAVLAKTSATLSGTANSIKKSKVVNVTTAAAASPTSLKFGNVAVGGTSASQVTTLTNKGTAPFAVSSIALTGTNATWFVLQSNTCPANLPPGGSCTIGVQFKPISAASKSAKLSIATSAANTPLSVSLSGTGF